MKSTETSCSPYLSKSLFVRGLQCHKSLYLHKCQPGLKGEITDAQQAAFAAGYEVGEFAQGLFPNGVNIPYDGNTHDEQVSLTKAAMNDGAKVIYEAAFTYDNIFVKVDILRRTARGWELYEVKSSASVKDVHLSDAAIQYYVLSGAGISVAKVSIIYINNEYVRMGDVEIKKLFAIQSITVMVRKQQATVKEKLTSMRTMLNGPMPIIDIGPHCEDPYECDFKGHCRKHIPENSVFELAGKGVDKFEFYRRGIIRQEDIPLDLLNSGQRFQVESTLNKRDTVDSDKVRKFLDTLWYPLCYLDFETFMSAVPPFDGTWPYQKIPFQYSLHIQTKTGRKPVHYEYLAQPGIDPRKEIVEGLLEQIPDNACVLTYWKSFEIGRLEELADFLSKHKKRIAQIINNARDLIVPFKQRSVYRWQMYGSASLKAVLPAMVPELSYEGLDISNGGMAMDAYHDMCGQTDPAERDKIRKALLEYCKLDTLAMVKIVEKLTELSKY